MIVFHHVTEGYVLMIKAQNTEETIQVAKDYVAALTKRMKKRKNYNGLQGLDVQWNDYITFRNLTIVQTRLFAYQYQSSGNEAVFFDKLDNEKIERAEDLQQVDFTKSKFRIAGRVFSKNGKRRSCTFICRGLYQDIRKI